ncbi:hypothetical protein [Paenibacillus larvae]|uniref:Uncharacterized protein n=1 Tax=Paenibacillus larvae subsp. larvae TaxID=147375 RepID=A0A6C0QXH8_9BACL|nr:hypothetical protein [Paenibacillus larvae]QHZ53383.1 hypothetical protein ERICV_04332 [Paenibacillus larvae subsp. larvae]
MEKRIIEYVGATTFAKMLGTTQQNVSEAGQRAIKPGYRGDFLRPDAVCDGRLQWLKENAEKYALEHKKD